jgi:hypothetical protein
MNCLIDGELEDWVRKIFQKLYEVELKNLNEKKYI